MLFWFPDSDREDYTEEHERLEEWLRSGTDRRLIIVGRHYDATIDYLTQIGQSEDSEQGLDYRRWLAEAVSVSHLESLEQQETYFDGWVEWTPGSRRRSSQLGGPWAAGLENANLTTIASRRASVRDADLEASELDPRTIGRSAQGVPPLSRTQPRRRR